VNLDKVGVAPVEARHLACRVRYGQTLPYLRARLARDRPHILARLDAGEFKSVRSAALEAGIIGGSFSCHLDPRKAARRIVRHFAGEDLAVLAREIAGPVGLEVVPADRADRGA
jgi:hypothetical protein